MRLHRPAFRFWPTAAAILLAYPISGAIYMLPLSARIVADTQHPISENIAVAIAEPFLGALMTSMSGGLPYMGEDAETRTDQYPVILPVMLALLALASGTVRFGRKPLRSPD